MKKSANATILLSAIALACKR